MSLVISDELVKASGLTESELRFELAVHLFVASRLTMAQAARLADKPLAEFMRLLGDREIPPHYDVADFREDLAAIEPLAKP
jgi:predicted HTH domain antitoxin